MPLGEPAQPQPDSGADQRSSPVTLRQIAEACGTSRMTVSRALRGLPRVEARLAEKIRAMATELGYRPNPALSRLMNATRLSSSGAYLETIAVISAGKGNYFAEELAGLRQEAELLHFKLDEFSPERDGISPDRMVSILEARGIRGLILTPGDTPVPRHYRLRSSRFISVLLGKSLLNPGMPRVQHDHYQAGIATMNQLGRLGYRRPGLVVGAGFHERSWRSYAAAMAAYAPESLDLKRAIYSSESSWPGTEKADLKALETWLRSYRPDCVLVENSGTAEILQALNPGLGLVVMSTSRDRSYWTGIVQQKELIGQEAIRLLAGRLLGENPKGPTHPPVVNIPGLWKEGRTLPRAGKGRASAGRQQ